jgi:hypothetical protein
MMRVFCGCRRLYAFQARPGTLQSQPCACGRVVAYVTPRSRWALLEVD